MKYLVINVRLNPLNELEEMPIFCIQKVEDFYTIWDQGVIEDDLCPLGSYNIVVTLN